MAKNDGPPGGSLATRSQLTIYRFAYNQAISRDIEIYQGTVQRVSILVEKTHARQKQESGFVAELILCGLLSLATTRHVDSIFLAVYVVAGHI